MKIYNFRRFFGFTVAVTFCLFTAHVDAEIVLKDDTGRYLLVDPVSASAPMTLLGRPIVEAVDMPDVAANAVPIVFGDLQGYRVIDRVSFSLLRDPYSQAAKGQVRLHARRRVGGDGAHPHRFVKQKVSV